MGAVAGGERKVEVMSAPDGHIWLCGGCAREQPEQGIHCGVRVILVEKKGLERAPDGRVLKATAAQIMGLYRKPTESRT